MQSEQSQYRVEKSMWPSIGLTCEIRVLTHAFHVSWGTDMNFSKTLVSLYKKMFISFFISFMKITLSNLYKSLSTVLSVKEVFKEPRLLITYTTRCRSAFWEHFLLDLLLGLPYVLGCSQSCPTMCKPWTVAHQAPLSMGFPKQEYWRWLPFPFPRDLPDSGIKPMSPLLVGRLFITEPPGKPLKIGISNTSLITWLTESLSLPLFFKKIIIIFYWFQATAHLLSFYVNLPNTPVKLHSFEFYIEFADYG